MKTGSPDYEIGYAKPPREHRWKKGCSGNPRGRRRRRKIRPPDDLIDGMAQALLNDQRVQLDGREIVVPLFVAWAQTLIRESLKAPLKDKLLLLRCLIDLGVAGRLRELKAEDEQQEEIFTDEDRAELARITADLPGLLAAYAAEHPDGDENS